MKYPSEEQLLLLPLASGRVEVLGDEVYSTSCSNDAEVQGFVVLLVDEVREVAAYMDFSGSQRRWSVE